MKVLHLTTAHADDDVRIYVKEAASLAQHYDTALIAPRRSQKVYSDVTYLPLRPAGTRAQRLLLQREALRLVQQFRPDVVHLHDPELVLLGLYLKTQGYKVVWDVHEDLPKQMQKKEWIPEWARGPGAAVVRSLEQLVTPHFDAVVSATSSIQNKFESHQRPLVVRNYPRFEEFSSVGGGVKKARFVYAGGISKERGVFEMIDALSHLRNTTSAELHLAGSFANSAAEEAVRSAQGVQYLGWLGREQIAEAYAGALAGMVTLHPTPNHIESLPIKMFEYMAAGLPVIASDFPLWRSILSKYRCGLLVDPLAPEQIAGAMRWMLDHPEEAAEMGRRGKEAVQTELNWDAEFTKLLAMYRTLETA